MEECEDYSLSGKAVLTEANLRDEYYWKLVADFIGPQSGEGLELDQGPCKNRVLIQVGLLKEDNNFPWVSIVDWLKKIFPMYRTADFRRLIERGIATTLSLLGDSRLTFLELAVNFNFVGPICDSVGIERNDLLELRDFSERAQVIEVTNGLVLELDDFIQRENLAPIVIVHWLQNFNSEFCQNVDYAKAYSGIKTKIKRLKIYSSNSETKSHRRNVAIESLLQSPFNLLSEELLSEKRGKKRKKEEAPNYKKITVKEEPESYEITTEMQPVLKETNITQIETNKKRNKDQDTASNSEDPCDNDKTLTLLDMAVASVHKLSKLYVGRTEACQEVCLELLQNQYQLMCKVHPAVAEIETTLAVFSEKISLGSPVEFIHHNANFIVEVHQLVEEQIVCLEKEVIHSSGSKLGRDKLTKFCSFVNFTESATSRYIHMACGFLSSMSRDNKTYRKHWLAFCKEKKNDSELMEESTNRIENYFEASASLIHHYKEIGPFFSDLLALESDKCPNIILESVAADSNDTIIQSFVCVLAIIYCKILGPYWQLFKSAAAYSMYSTYLLSLYQKFLDWLKEPATLLEFEQGMNVFAQFPMQERTYRGVFSYCGVWHTNRELIRASLKRMVKAIATAADKHLRDYLPGGKYSQAPSPDLCRKISNCLFSAMLPENPFGETFSNNKKQPDPDSSSGSEVEEDITNAYAEGGSDDEMTRHNGSVDEGEIEEKQQPSKRGPKRFPEIMDQDYIVETVKRNGGPCRTQQDVEKMMLRCERMSRAERYECVRCEVLYQKMILNNTSPHLVDKKGNATTTVARLMMALPRVKPGFSLVLAPRRTPRTKCPKLNSCEPEAPHSLPQFSLN